MNPSIGQLYEVASKRKKIIVGLMSGTSRDGLDIALCTIEGSGADTRVQLSEFTTCSYSSEIVDRLDEIVSRDEIDLEQLCLAHTWLGELHADLVMERLREWGTGPDQVDCIASHGQTAYHAPFTKHRRKGIPNATLQIGDGDHIARKTGILTISDFRQKHTAAGGEGAPLVSYTDEMLFSHPSEDRLLLNIGGIANFTWLPAQNAESKPVKTDTGPGNVLIDQTVQELTDKPYDPDGEIAATGKVNADLLKGLLGHDFFDYPLPRSTGPELFNLDWVRQVQKETGTERVATEDLVATLTWFTAQTITDTITKVEGENKNNIYVSGGGMHNKTLFQTMKKLLPDHSIESFESIGFNPDAKEAVSFAVLANEMLSGEGFLVDPYQGVERRVNFGKISFPV